MKSKILILIVGTIFSVGCSSTSGLGRGAFSTQYLPQRLELGQRVETIISASRPEVELILAKVREMNRADPQTGTGALLGVILPRLASESLTGGTIQTKPLGGP